MKNGEHTSATCTITVETAEPEIEISPDGATALPLNADIVITFKEPLYWTGGESDMMPVSVYCAEDDFARDVWVDASAFLDGGMERDSYWGKNNSSWSVTADTDAAHAVEQR